MPGSRPLRKRAGGGRSRTVHYPECLAIRGSWVVRHRTRSRKRLELARDGPCEANRKDDANVFDIDPFLLTLTHSDSQGAVCPRTPARRGAP
ncbi:MAG: hypothetical protein AB7Q17_16700, partial [Phycisphaerae bacterium]